MHCVWSGGVRRAGRVVAGLKGDGSGWIGSLKNTATSNSKLRHSRLLQTILDAVAAALLPESVMVLIIVDVSGDKGTRTLRDKRFR